MEIRKTYKNLEPELLFDEVKDFLQKHGAVLGESKLQTYSLPGGSSHTVRATASFKILDEKANVEKECVSVHIVGSVVDKTKLMLDIDDELFPSEKTSAFREDLDFIFGGYEVKE